MRGVLAMALMAPLAACASSGGFPLAVESDPAGAAVTTSAGAGCPSTPCTLNVSDDADFTVTVSLNGYEPATQSVTRQTTGGSSSTVAGMFAGGETTLAPNPVRVSLRPAAQAYSAYPASPAYQTYSAPQAQPAYNAPAAPPQPGGGAPLGAPSAAYAPLTQGAPLQTPAYPGPNSRGPTPQTYTAPAYAPPQTAYAPPPQTAYAPPAQAAYAPPAQPAYAPPAGYTAQQSYAPTPYPPQALGAAASCRLTTENVSGGAKTCLYSCNGQPHAVAVGFADSCAWTLNR